MMKWFTNQNATETISIKALLLRMVAYLGCILFYDLDYFPMDLSFIHLTRMENLARCAPSTLYV